MSGSIRDFWALLTKYEIKNVLYADSSFLSSGRHPGTSLQEFHEIRHRISPEQVVEQPYVW